MIERLRGTSNGAGSVLKQKKTMAMTMTSAARKYLTCAELEKKWQCQSNDLCCLIIQGRLKPAVMVLQPMAAPAFNFRHQRHPRTPLIIGADGSPDLYRYPGWLYLQNPVQTAAFDCEFELANGVRDPGASPLNIFDEDLYVDEGVLPYNDFWFRLPNAFSFSRVQSEAVFFVDEIERYELEQKSAAHSHGPERPVTTVERNTLLTIIAVLCKDAGYDYTKHAKTAGSIASAAAFMEVSIGESTIEGKLKLIPEALATRMK